MKVHVIIDFSHLYYKYKFRLEKGFLTRLTSNVNINGTVVNRDISIMYYAMRDIEMMRKRWKEHDVVVSVCFDMPSLERKQIANDSTSEGDYKGGRKNHLGEDDFSDIRWIEQILSKAGHNTYRYDGCEADDLIHEICKRYESLFDAQVIVTNDKDLMVNITDKTSIFRYKSTKDYSLVTKDSFTSYMTEEMKCTIPFNAILLFLSTVGDSADNIKGIFRFGAKAFDKYINYLIEKGVDFSKLTDAEKAKEVLLVSDGYFSQEQIEQATSALELVKPMNLEHLQFETPCKVSTYESRVKAYSPFNMKSLFD